MKPIFVYHFYLLLIEVCVYNYTSMNSDRCCKQTPHLFCLELGSHFSTIQFYAGKLQIDFSGSE